jgi:hypothetical protein
VREHRDIFYQASPVVHAQPHRLPGTGKPALKAPMTTLLPKPKAGQAIPISLP